MSKITAMLVLLGAVIPLSSANAAGDCPPGQVMHRMGGGCVPQVTPAKTYAGCLQNGRTLGYSAADAESYCKHKFQKWAVGRRPRLWASRGASGPAT